MNNELQKQKTLISKITSSFWLMSLIIFFTIGTNVSYSQTTYTFNGGDIAVASNWSPAPPRDWILYNGEIANINGNGFLEDNFELSSGATLNINANLSLRRGGIINKAGGTITVNGNMTLTGYRNVYGNPVTGWVDNKGSLNINPGGNVNFGQVYPGSISNSGTINNYGQLSNKGLTNYGILNNNNGGNFILENYPTSFPEGTFIWNSGSTVTIGIDANLATNAMFIPTGCTLQVYGTLTLNGANGNNWTLYNFGNVINNGTINIGNISSVTDNGIVNVGTFNNNTNGKINIDRTLNRAIDNYGAAFNNSGSIVIGANASVGQYGLINQTIFNNNAGGQIEVSNAWELSFHNLTGTFTNSGSLTNNGTFNSNAIFNLNAGGNLVLNSGYANLSVGTFNWNASSTLTVGSNFNLATNALLVPSGSTLQVNGTLTIDGKNGNNWTLYSIGNVNNNGTIKIGSTSSVEANGIPNYGTFNNNKSGKIIIDRTTDRAIDNLGTFNNSGSIVIGANASVGQFGLINQNIFNNNAGGQIEVGNAAYLSFYNHGGGNFTNSGSLTNNGTFNNTTIFNLNAGGNLVLNTNPASLPGGTFNWNNGGNVTIGSSGNFTLASAMSVEAGRTFAVDGSLTINSGSILTTNSGSTLAINSTGTITNNGILKGTGTLIQNGAYAGGLTGSINPGASPGTFHVSGNFDLGGNTFVSENYGTIAGTEYDVLSISGDANLDNSKLVVDWGTFVPTLGNSFTAIQYGSHTGEFAEVTIPPVDGLTFTLDYTNTNLTISAITKQTIPWAGGASGDWSDPSNWGGGIVPSPSDSVAFPSATTPYEIVITDPISIQSLSLGSNCTLTLSSGVDLTVNGTFTINSGATLNVGSSTITLDGNWDNSGTLNAGTGKFILNGVTQQTMFGSTFNDLEINNPAGIVMLTEENVNGVLTLTSGTLTLGTNNLNLGLNATIVGANAEKFIVTNSTGRVNRAIAGGGSFQFPIGATATSYSPITLELASDDPTETFGVRVEPFSAASIGFAAINDKSQIVNRLWYISEGTDGGNNAKLTFQWNSSENGTTLGVSSTSPVSVDAFYFNPGINNFKLSGNASGPAPGSNPVSASTDEYSATVFSSFIIGATDQPPVITAPENVSLVLGVAIASIYSGPTATAIDSYDKNPVVTSVPSLPAAFTEAGIYKITYTATDVNGKSSTAEQTITVKPTTMLINSLTISSLQGLLPVSKNVDKKIDDAIKYIQQSVSNELWFDEYHLSAKKGEKVFESAKEAVNQLSTFLIPEKNGKNTNSVDAATSAAVDNVILTLVDVDKTLATLAVTEAQASLTDAKSLKKIKEAEKKMDDAQKMFEAEKYSQAIDKYKEAWKSIAEIKGNSSHSLANSVDHELNLESDNIPVEFRLDQNYPNPFNPTTKIHVAVAEAGNYTLKVFNIIGQEVATLVSGQLERGNYKFNFDASKLSSGVYIYNIRGNNVNVTKKMNLLK